MRFTQIDPSDAEKEYSLVIDIAQGKDITGMSRSHSLPRNAKKGKSEEAI